jgi:hypothetical protein
MCQNFNHIRHRVIGKLFMAPSNPEDSRMWKTADEDDDALHSAADEDIFEDAADSAEQLEAPATSDQQKGLGEDAEAEDPNDESQMTESSHFLREAFGRDREEDEYFDAEEQKRHHTGRESRLKQSRQCDAVVPPDQLEV